MHQAPMCPSYSVNNCLLKGNLLSFISPTHLTLNLFPAPSLPD